MVEDLQHLKEVKEEKEKEVKVKEEKEASVTKQPEAKVKMEKSDPHPLCIGPGCPRQALPESVYCGTDCILQHAAFTMKTLSVPTNARSSRSRPQRKPTTPTTDKVRHLIKSLIIEILRFVCGRDIKNVIIMKTFSQHSTNENHFWTCVTQR